MPVLKKKSLSQRRKQQQCLKTGDASMTASVPMSPSAKRQERLERLRENQKLRLSDPVKRAVHLKRLRDSQLKRISDPAKRAVHLKRLQDTQKKRISDPAKRAVHLKRLQDTQKKRISDPVKRAVHLKRLQDSRRKRISDPTKRAVHLKRLRDSQLKRLSDPMKRAVHLERLKECQRRRLSIPANRALHLERLKENQRKRLQDVRLRRIHHKRLRDAQKKRLADPVGRILQICRVAMNRSLWAERGKETKRRTLYNEFIREKKQGPTESCQSCHRLWFKTSVKYYGKHLLDQSVLEAACELVEGDSVKLCASCYKAIRSKKLPTYSLGNVGLKFIEIPPQISCLTELEERFLCPRIPFMSIRAAVSDQQYLVKGRAVNVPANVPTSVNILPRTFSETKVVPICFKRKKSFKTNVAFENVRPKVIRDAAEFLRNSPLYRHFNITLDVSRIDSDVLPSIPKRINDVESNEQEPDSVNGESGVEEECVSEDEEVEPVNIQDDYTMLTTAIVYAPGEGNKPESLFADYVEAQSFLKIYGGELVNKPPGMSYQNWVKSEIMRDDRRCANVTKLFFSALKLRTAKMSSSISFCLRKAKCKKTFTASEILNDQTARDLELHDSGFRIFLPDRGSPAYWESKKKELFAMLRTLGPPTFFVTLGPCETRWPELIVILKKVVDNVDIHLDEVHLIPYRERVRLVKEDPVTVARYFEYRMRRLLRVVMGNVKSCYGESVFREHIVTDFYVRVEFQTRGSPHLHCLFWNKQAPIYREDGNNSDVISFIDRFISCSSFIPSDVRDLQTHKHTFTCKKGLKNPKKKCRFDIPFFPVDETIILCPVSENEYSKEELVKMRKTRKEIQDRLYEIHKNQDMMKTTQNVIGEFGLSYCSYINVIRSGLKRVTVVLKRTPCDCMINFYNPDILMLHEANMDIQFLTDMYACATYILDYLNKSNAGMSKLLREAAAEIRQGNQTMKDQIRALANCFLNASEFSAQEAVYYVMGLSLSSCSRKCTFINTNRPESRVVVVKRKADLEALPVNSTDIFVKNILDHYIERPMDMESCTLADFVAWYEFSKSDGKKYVESDDEKEECDSDDGDEEALFLPLLDKSGFVRQRKKSKIIRFCNYNEHSEDYVRENVMLFWHWRNEAAMMESAEEIFETYKKEIMENRSKYVFNEKLMNELHNAAQVQVPGLSDADNDSQYETPANLRIFKAIDSQTAALPDEDIEKVAPRHENIRQDEMVLPVPKMITEDEYAQIVSTLNEKQHIFLLHVLNQFKENRGPCHYIVRGKAGCGKSRLIECIHQSLLRYYNSCTGDLDTLKVLLCSPTGKASFAIRGTTIHSAFVLPLNQCAVDLVPLNSATRNTLWTKMRDVKLIIIDEISMVGSRMFQQIDCRLKEIFQSPVPFAGLSLILFGDFGQLAPVADKYVFQSNIQGTYGAIAGNPLWDLFTSYELTQIMRQRDDAVFAEALSNLVEGRMTVDEVALLRTRQVPLTDVPQDAIRLFRTNYEVDAYNNSVINSDSNKLCVDAVDRVTGQPNEAIKERLLKSARCSLAKDCQGLPFHLYLSLGIKYMITVNVNVQDGLVNGAVGTLKEIDQVNGEVTRIWLSFPDDDVGKDRRREVRNATDPRLIALDRVVRTIKPSKSPHSVIRKQFPIVPAEAITIHKSQGGTYSSVAVQLSKGLRRNELYVALSRCTKLSGLYLIGQFNPPPAPSPNDSVVTELKRLESKPIAMSCIFPSKFPNDLTIVYHNIQSLRKTSHFLDFMNYMTLHKPSLFIAAETWTTQNDDLNIDNYTVTVRMDCSSRRHGFGLVVYARNDVLPTILYSSCNEDQSTSSCLATLMVDGVCISTGYKPPSTTFKDFEQSFLQCLISATSASSRCIVLGDFNIDVNSTEANKTFLAALQSKGFHSQLPVGTSTTNVGTGIDCVFSNFNHLAGVCETLFSYHKQLVVVPSQAPAVQQAVTTVNVFPTVSTGSLQAPTPRQSSVHTDVYSTHSQKASDQLTVTTAIMKSKRILTSLQSKLCVDQNDILSLKHFLSFVQQSGLASCQGKVAKALLLPSYIRSSFQPIITTGDGNCFYYAVSRQLCGREGLASGLRALVAYHIKINENFLENLPLSIGQCSSWTTVLKSCNYAEIAEVVILSYILNKPINIYTDSLRTSLRFAPTPGPDINLYLDMTLQHYSSLQLKGKKKPPIPDTVANLPHRSDMCSL